LRTSIASTDTPPRPLKGEADGDSSVAGVVRPASLEAEIEALKRSLQEQRRATTLLNAETQRQTEAREAMEAQLIEANAEIAASWDRRKEMTRVIGDREDKLADAKAELEASREQVARLSEERDSLLALRDRQAELERELGEARLEANVNRERRKEIALVVTNRDAKIAQLRAQVEEMGRIVSNRDEKIAQLRAELQARYEEMAKLERHIERTSLSGRTRRFFRPITRLF
jgi:chromosome segregation ATPase